MPARSLRRNLLRQLLLVLMPTLLLGSALTFYVASARVRDAFDFGLLDHARDIAHAVELRDGQLALELPPVAREMLKTINEDHLTYAVWDTSQRLLAGDAQLQMLAPRLDGESFRFATVHAKPRTRRLVLLRSAIDDHAFYVVVAQTTGGMLRIQRSIFSSVFFFGALLIMMALAGVYFGVRRGLRPIAWLRREIEARSPVNLAPVDAELVPRELQPIVDNVNTLMKQLEQALNSHRRFIADAAHQLRTPLAALCAQIEVAQQLPAGQTDAALADIAQTARRTSHVGNQLLSLARLEHSAQSTLRLEELAINDLFSEVLPSCVERAELNGIELEFDLVPCRLLGNKILLQELLSNLLENALRYVPRGGHVKTQARVKNGVVALTITDDGPGVADAALTKLGTPFFRLAENHSEGCGLGLAIAREIVQVHRGSLHFSHATPRGGLRIDIELPAITTAV